MNKNISNRFKKIPLGIVERLDEVGDFALSLVEYFFHKIDQLLIFIHSAISHIYNFVTNLKFNTSAKLIWSRGKVGGKVKYLFLILLAWTIFLAGGVFQSSLTESTPSSDVTYLRNQNKSILLESVTAATYESDKKLLDSPIEHTVEENETLDSIGKKYGITLESIKFANNLTGNYIKQGQKLIIPPVEGTVHVVKKGDTVDKLAKKYNVASQSIVDFNYLDAPYTLEEGMSLTIPEAKRQSEQRFFAGNTYDTSAYGLIPYVGGVVKGSGEFLWPLAGQISQYFSSYHPAIDIAANSGDIIASDKGTVVRAGWWQGGYGNAVQIDHGNGYVTTYAHMSVISVSQGDNVEKGQKIGVVGSTGRSTGPHCHFTIQKDGRFINPLTVL